MRTDRLHMLLTAFGEFYAYAPSRLLLMFALMLVQGLTAGIGLLMLIPLLHLLGFDFGGGSGSSEFAVVLSSLISGTGMKLSLPLILSLYVLVIALTALLRYGLTVLTTEVQQSYICHLRHRLYSALLHSRWQFIIGHKMSDFTHCLTSQVQSIGMAARDMLFLASQLLLVMIYIGLSLLLSWQMSLLALGCGLLLLLVLLPLNRAVLRSGSQQLGGNKAIYSMFTEQLASLKMIKSYGSEDQYLNEVNQQSHQLEKQVVRMTRINAVTQLVYMIGAAISFSVYFYFAISWLSVSLATLLLLLLIFSRLLPQLSTIQSGYQRLLHKLPAFEDVRRMMSECESAMEQGNSSQLAAPQLQHQLVLEKVNFSYASGNRQIIDQLSLTIPRNATIALVGPSGAGKTTLADLIAGLLIPDSGRILCDDVELADKQRLAWRRGVAYITQEVFLFHDTVRANLAWVCQDADEAILWQALEMAAAADFVHALPDQLDTVIGDRGIRLSGGERQRLALARALLSKPQLLILDEATSALDHENETKIQQALQQLDGKLTIIIIAHRETTIAHVRQRIVLGDHSDLA